MTPDQAASEWGRGVEQSGISEHICDEGLQPCPSCGAEICLECEDWRKHHSLAGRASRLWRRLVSKLPDVS